MSISIKSYMISRKRNLPRDDLIRYMDENGIRKRRAAKRWTRNKEVEWEGLCKQLREKKWEKLMIIQPVDHKV